MLKKKYGVYIVSALLIASMAGCTPAANTAAETGDTEITKEVTATAAVSEDTAEPDIIEEPEEVFTGTYVKVGQEFTMTEGDVVRVEGDDDYELILTEVSAVNGIKKSYFTQIINGKEAPLIWWETSDEVRETFGTEEDYTESYGSFQAYPMTLSYMKKPEVTLTLSEKIIVPEPITFSGNADIIYNSSEYNYIETEHCFIYLDSNVDIPENIGVAIEETIASLEEVTGYTFQREGSYNECSTVNTANVYLGFDPWYGVNADRNKIDVFIFADDGTCRISCASDNEVVLIPEDFLTEDHSIKIPTIAHEFTHVLTQYEFGYIGNIMTEGTAEFYSHIVADMLKDEYEMTEWDTEKALGYLDSLAYSNNPEELFSADYDNEEGIRTNRPYQYGLALNTYLYETYGENYLHEFQEKINDGRFYYDEPEYGVEAAVLKELYGDSLFTDFQKWYKENKTRFEFPES